LLPRVWSNRNVKKVATSASSATLLVLGLALFCALQVALNGRIQDNFVQWQLVRIGVYFDVLSAVIFLLVSFLGAIVTRYALNYLKGDAEQGHFLKWLCITIGAVLMLIVSSNLVMFTAAWVATSLSLNQLLTFYSDRPAALVAARKKFVISRLGDLCLIAAVILTYRVFGTWEFSVLFDRAEDFRTYGAGAQTTELTWLCLALVGGAMLKSAQFPFHSWLPDTMETPTPVSALMHAGIINAGGFLIVRLSPLVTLSPVSLHILAAVGAFTAIFASLVMMTQASVKRMLAFSTIAQMGFMMLQCGLGAFSIAVLHIVAHSLYKAHTFLSSGSVVSISKSSWVPTTRPAAHPGVLVAALTVAVALTFGAARAFGISPLTETGSMILASVFVMAQTHLLWSLWGQSITLRLVAFGVLLASAVSVAYFALHFAFKHLLASSLPAGQPLRAGLDGVIVVAVIMLFGAALVLQSQLPIWASQPWCRALYVHARNGFYFNTLANRAIQAIWPAR
jgi:NAD(P)H-quinone oxidoreductase subunit 5